MTSTLIGCPVPPSERYDLALLDLDGVVYVGRHAVPGAPEAIGRLREQGVRTAYVTNNASRPPDTVAAHLTEIGVATAPDEVVTSAQAAAALLARRLPPGSPVLVVGGEGLYRALTEAGLRPVASMDDEPVAVTQGFGPEVGWHQLAEGTRAVRAGLPWIATNTDLTVPTPYGPAPGNGTLVAAVAAASETEPEVAGKPQPPLFREAVLRYGSTRPIVIGDRLDTDLEGARAAGLDGLLVLTGVTRVTGLLAAAPGCRPHLVARDLGGMFEPHPAPEQGGEGVRCGDAVVAATGTGLEVVATGDDPIDLLRAAAVAAWAAADAGGGAAADAGGGAAAGPVLEALHRMEPDGPWGH